jgi:integrase/recombinase XerD
MSWDTIIKDFGTHLQLERSLSDNTLEAYLDDISKLRQFSETLLPPPMPEEITYSQLKEFVKWVHELGVHPRSQARILSGLRTFYKFMLMENLIENDPTALLESPKIGRKLPEVLSIEEIDKLIGAIDLSKPEGQRNKAMLETLYSCGLRVSELVSLKISDLHFDSGFLKVVGKGDKERLIPVSPRAIKEIQNYMPDRHKLLDKMDSVSENIVFLNSRGKGLSRVMIFTIIKQLARMIDLKKTISPHTFRHSFATHLVDGGADLRAVQEMLGHESIQTTEIYTHLDREFLRDTIIRFHPRS